MVFDAKYPINVGFKKKRSDFNGQGVGSKNVLLAAPFSSFQKSASVADGMHDGLQHAVEYR